MSETQSPADESPANEPAHDVLAAEAFAVPAPDPVLHHGPVRLPEDPTGIEEPHDVLAAEDFAMPAPPPAAGSAMTPRGASPKRLSMMIALGAVAVMVVWRLLRPR